MDLCQKCETCCCYLEAEDLFCTNCGTEVPVIDGVTPNPQPTLQPVVRHYFDCQQCGASMSYDASVGSLRCPFCGSVEVKDQPQQLDIAPNRVVPFQVERPAATESLQKWLNEGFFRPPDLAEMAEVTSLVQVFVPYWVFHAQTKTTWTADTSDVPWGAKAAWRPISGEHQGSHQDVLIPASQTLTAKESFSIFPFQIKDAIEYRPEVCAGISVERFGLSRRVARPYAKKNIERRESQECDDLYIPASSRNVHVNILYSQMRSEPILVPLWIFAYRYKKRMFRFVVNGQTGRAFGDKPFSMEVLYPYIGYTVIGFLALCLIMMLMILFMR
ncbi:Primosomal protein N' (Replication factor Y)-superfamily II helicase [Planctomycetales bacterium 10988]|nr:Primosomal protein N' (Replication factor Y)-superfamily II helicase [Planctomycetales bacterium 10988]